MRYSSLKLLFYISEASGFGRSSKSVGPSPSVEELTKTKPGSPMPKSSGKKKIYPGVDPNVLGKDNTVGKVGAEAGQFSVDALLNFGTGIPGAGSAKVVANVGRLTTDRTADLLIPLTSELIKAERNAQQEAVRSMSNVSNFYKNLGVTTIPLTPKNSLVDTIASLLKPKPTP